MNKAQRDLRVTNIIAKLIGYSWKSGSWHRNDKPVTDYFDPMNDEAAAKALADEFDIEVYQTLDGFTAETPDPNNPDTKLTANGLTPANATSLLVCKLAGESPE